MKYSFIMLGRALRAEYSKLAHARSTYIVALLATVLPWIITTWVSYLMNMLSTIGDVEQNVEGMLYWTRVLGITIFMVWAVTTVTAEIKHGTFATIYIAVPRWWIILLAKWLAVGSVALVTVLVTQPLFLLSQKYIFPSITSVWNWSDPQTIQFLWAQPLYAFLAVGLCIGLGAICRSAAPALGIVLVWEFVAEPGIGSIANVGMRLLPWLPFYNADLFAGQEKMLESPIGVTGAGIYWLVLALVAVALGMLACRRYQRKR